MLEQRVAVTPLGAADELGAIDGELTSVRLGEARRHARPHGHRAGTGHLCLDIEPGERTDEQRIDLFATLTKRATGDGRRHAVRDFAVVEQRASAGRASHHIDARRGEPRMVEPAERAFMPAE